MKQQYQIKKQIENIWGIFWGSDFNTNSSTFMTPHRNVVHSEMARKNVPVVRTKAKFSSINDKREELQTNVFFRHQPVNFVKCIKQLFCFDFSKKFFLG